MAVKLAGVEISVLRESDAGVEFVWMTVTGTGSKFDPLYAIGLRVKLASVAVTRTGLRSAALCGIGLGVELVKVTVTGTGSTLAALF